MNCQICGQSFKIGEVCITVTTAEGTFNYHDYCPSKATKTLVTAQNITSINAPSVQI